MPSPVGRRREQAIGPPTLVKRAEWKERPLFRKIRLMPFLSFATEILVEGEITVDFIEPLFVLMPPIITRRPYSLDCQASAFARRHL
jgi:hypothetical protein